MEREQDRLQRLSTLSREELHERLGRLERTVAEGNAGFDTYEELIECVRRLAQLEGGDGSRETR